ncbi:MAG: VCBS repeat-containing protein [Polyangiaceae bacterium]|nr:VCBS repeat-containing protein [Polyangiaceae bacterium]
MPRPLTITSVLALAFAAACSPGPHVRPFPELGPGFRLRPADDLPGQLERAGRELEGAGLHETFRVEGKLRGGATFVAIAAEGRDPFGREAHALRVVTPAAIVLALGPADPASPRPDDPVRLVRHLNDAGAYPSGRDLTGDGTPDVAARAPDGTLALYAVDLLSASRYPVALGAPPTEAEDVSGDGLPDLLGAPRPLEGDPIAPRLLDVAIGQGSAFRDDAPAARAYHRHALEAPAPPASAPPAARLKAALERSFHAMRAGDPPGRAFQPAADLAASLAPLPDALAASWVRWRGYVADRALRDPLQAPRPAAE